MGEQRCSRPCLPLPRATPAATAAELTRLRRPLLARTMPGRAAAALGQAAIAAGIITAGGSRPGSRLRKPVVAQPQ